MDSANREYVRVPMPKVENPDLDAVRRLAIELATNYDHHEVAISDPFTAEEQVRGYGKRLLELVGWPEGCYMYEPVGEDEHA